MERFHAVRHLRIALYLWRNRPTRHEALGVLIGRNKLANWEIDLILERPHRR